MRISFHSRPFGTKVRIFLYALVMGLTAVSAALYAGMPGVAPVQLWIDTSDTPRVGEPLTLNFTIAPPPKVSGFFQLQLTAPPGVTLAAQDGNLSGRVREGAAVTIARTLTPRQLGDLRVTARLQFQPEGGSAPFTVDNAAVLRVRSGQERSQVFVDQQAWSVKSLSDRIKEAKASLRAVSAAERNRQLRLLQGLPAAPPSAAYRVPDAIVQRQQGYRQAAQARRSESSGLSDAARAEAQAALKESWLGARTVTLIGSPERYSQATGLVQRQVPVSFVYRKELALSAGELYTLETRNLTPGSDTILYLFAYDEGTGQPTLVAQNDDADELTFSSRIRYVPEQDGAYVLLARSYSYETRGECDIYINDAWVERTEFAGVAFRIVSDAGDVLQTVALRRTPQRTDTWMFVQSNGDDTALWDDDGGMELGSRLVLPDLRPGEVVIGAFAQAAEGTCDLILNTADGSFGAHPRGDLDGDGLSNELERALGTDPTSEDTDGDGFLDIWEVIGVRDTDYPSLGADPTGTDIYVQTDWMASTHNHQPREDSIQMIIDSFASEGITLHVDRGNEEEGGMGHLLPPPWMHIDSLGLGSATHREIKANNFDSAKRGGLYHYAIFAHRQPNNSCSSGVAYISGSDLLVTLGCFLGQIGTVYDQAGTFMHELGHNLSLRHGGNVDTNYKPNYRSVMNYLFQIGGTCGRLGFNNGVTYAPCNPREYFYSHGLGIDLDENCLDESVGIGEDAIDWNGDGQIDTCVQADINYQRGQPPDRRFDLLRDYDDYSHLRIPLAGFSQDLPVPEEIVTCAPPLPE